MSDRRAMDYRLIDDSAEFANTLRPNRAAYRPTPPSWLPVLREYLTSLVDDARDTAVDVGSRIRYGVSEDERDRLEWERGLPGAPPPGSPGARRYTSAYLGARKWGPGLAKAFNAIAAQDSPVPNPANDWEGSTELESVERKVAGEQGAEAGAKARDEEERLRRERLLALFEGRRLGR